ncbi:hypothetical protein AB4Y72_17170 [Arthrobacter sp. YAF34]|uniref:hypothetical protein n=1 Tax=Arthrobacter sp. YAF34 TaxID=3233083 RepID=UPI003F90BE1F
MQDLTAPLRPAATAVRAGTGPAEWLGGVRAPATRVPETATDARCVLDALRLETER